MLRSRDSVDLVVIGGGIAGLTAAVHAARRGLSVALLERELAFGGQVATVNALDDWPALGVTSGVELAAALAQQARDLGARMIIESVRNLTFNALHLTIETASAPISARRVLVATGARLRSLGVAGEEQFRGKGVSQCAHCDGPFFRNEDVVVVGGGDAALQEALVLAQHCRSVTIVARSALRARQAYVDRAAGLDNIQFEWESAVTAILGRETVTGVRLNTASASSATDIACSGVFPFVGVTPNTACLPATIDRDPHDTVKTDADYRTAVPGVFAVGAVRSGYRGDLISAAGEAASAVAVIARELSH